jgi:hypothetical protein
MKRRTRFARLEISGVWIFIPGFALAQHDLLSLKQGLYVTRSEPPRQPIHDEHNSHCLGDRTPDRSGYVDNFLLTRLSSIGFSIHNDTHPDTTSRWCSADGPDNPKARP